MAAGLVALVAAGAVSPALLPCAHRAGPGAHASTMCGCIRRDGCDYLATAGRLHFTLWSHAFFANRTALFPGVTASAARRSPPIGSGVAWRDRRARMALAFGIVGFALSFGANLPGYETLHDAHSAVAGDSRRRALGHRSS